VLRSEGDELAVIADDDEVQARRPHGDLPLGEILAVLVEDLDATVVAIIDEYAPRLDVDPRRRARCSCSRAEVFLAGFALNAEVEQELAAGVELRTRVPL